MIKERLALIRKRVADAARKIGRDPNEITIVAVSKVKPVADIVTAYEAGQRHFGESYIQEFQSKREELPPLPGVVFHMIGRLQSNKTKQASKFFDVIQTVDSEKLVRRLNGIGKNVDVFFEVKLSGGESRAGLAEADIEGVKRFVEDCPYINLRGLMGMPPWCDDPEHVRPYFQRLRYLAQQYALPELSMGMSRDFEIAIEEESTLIRIGTAIFGKRVHPK